MTQRTTRLLVAAIVVLSALPVGVMAATGALQADGPVAVTTGQQLSTVLSVTDAETRAEVDEVAFATELNRSDDGSRAEVLATRATVVRERAATVRAEYEAATAAYEAGDLSDSQYARTLAQLTVRAELITAAWERLQTRASEVSALDLRVAGYDGPATTRAVESLDVVRGSAPDALVARFTGRADGEVRIRSTDGVEIEVEREDGETSREVERPRDDDDRITVNASVALDTARSTLADVNGTWVHTGTKVDHESGYYEFEFTLRSGDRAGEAEVRVDGSTGHVFRIEEDFAARGAERDDDRDRDDDREADLTLLVTDGEPAPGATVTLRVLADRQPVEGARVSLDEGQSLGTTDADGFVTVTLPSDDEVELHAVAGEREGDLRFEFAEHDDEVERDLRVETTRDGDSVTLRVTYAGDPVADVSVEADGRAVGTTDADGRLTIDVSSFTEDVELRLEKGAFEAETELELNDRDAEDATDDDERDSDDKGDSVDERETDDGDEREATATDGGSDDEREPDEPDDDRSGSDAGSD